MKKFPPRKSALSPSQRRLLNLMQAINFGRIERLRVQSGQPVFDPAPRVLRDIKIGAENGPRAESELSEFTLRREFVDLFEQLAHAESGVVHCLVVRHGLPFSLSIETTSEEGEALADSQTPHRRS